MKNILFTMISLVAILISAGCITTDTKTQQSDIGKTITFTTKEPAPADFDSWTFFWQYPRIERFDADFEYVVIHPNGTEYYVYKSGITPFGGTARSDFWPGMCHDIGIPERDMIGPFHGKSITIVFRATKGLIRFPSGNFGGFAFYKKGDNGKIDRDHPVKRIDGVRTK